MDAYLGLFTKLGKFEATKLGEFTDARPPPCPTQSTSEKCKGGDGSKPLETPVVHIKIAGKWH